ncbi:MAG: CxxC-x17-CxxC domain-containing protein [Candidatus Micrarchaeota archaeon]
MGFRDNRGGDRGGGHRSFHGGHGGGGGGGGGYRGHSGPRELHDATCSDCGATCKVPFTPTPGRPVYCDACFPNHRSDRGDRDGGRSGGYGGGRPRDSNRSSGSSDNQPTNEPAESSDDTSEDAGEEATQ